MSEVSDLFNKVVIAWASNPQVATGGIYVNGELEVTFDEKGARRPSAEYIRAQAQRHVKYAEEGNEIEEINLKWPLPAKLPEAPAPKGKVKVSGGASDELDPAVKRTDDAVNK